MKYIMFKTEVAKGVWIFEPTIFPEVVPHFDVAESFLNIFTQYVWSVHSAGFYQTDRGCYGESDSLGLMSDPKDTERVALAVAGETVIETDL